MSRFARPLALLATVLSILSLAGCGGGTDHTSPAANQQWHPQPGLAAALPFPVDRATSVLTSTTMNGMDFTTASSGLTTVGTSIQLDATATSIEFAIYTFHPGNTPNQVDVNIDEAHTTEYWVAVADYTKTHWEFDGPFTTSQSFALSADNVSPLGNIPVAVVTPPSKSVRIDTLKLTYNNTPPTASFTASAGGPAPIQINVDASASSDPDGSISLYEWDWQNDGTYDDSAATPIANHIYSAAGTFTIKLRVTDNGGVTATTTQQVTVTSPVNQAPHAVVTASPNAAAPYDSTLDASGSSDPDGTIVDYAWDLDNNGTYETDTGTTPTEVFHVPAVGAYTIGLKVTDNVGGLGGTDTTTITIKGTGWKGFTFPITGDEVGRLNSLAVINGKPAIAMHVYDSSQNPVRTVRYAYSTTPTGADPADWQIVTTPLAISGGQQISLAEIDGHPAIAWSDGGNNLGYSRSSTALGGAAADWAAVKADATAFVFQAISMTTISGNPAIAYQSNPGFFAGQTFYVRSSSLDGMTAGDWGTPVLVDGDGATFASGNSISLAEIAGSPALACSSNTSVVYARANNTTGTPATAWSGAGSSHFALDASAQYGSLCVVNGFPAVAYQRNGPDDLYFALANTNSGGALADWSFVDADSTGSAGYASRLAVIAGKPAVISQDITNSELQFTHASTVSGSAATDWPDSSVVDPSGSTGFYDSLCEVNGQAAISYYVDAPDYKLRYAILFE